MSIMKTEKFNNVTLEISNKGKLAIKETSHQATIFRNFC